MLTWLRSLLFTIIFYGLSLPIVSGAFLASLISPAALASASRFWSAFHRWCARWILGQKVRIEGDLPHGPYLYIFKHESMFETIDMPYLLNNPAIVAKRELMDIPLWGWMGRKYGLIPVERTAGAAALRTMRAEANRHIAAGRPICLFPEGTRVPHGEAPPLRAGFAGLYAILRLPVVPVAVDSGRLSPRGRFRKSAGIITYKVGAIIPVGLDRAEAERQVHAAINALNPQP